MKIKSGCMVVVVKSKAGNQGLSGKVIKYLGEVDGFEGKNRWETDFSGIKFLGGSPNGFANHFEEDQLMRIDGIQECEIKENSLFLESDL